MTNKNRWLRHAAAHSENNHVAGAFPGRRCKARAQAVDDEEHAVGLRCILTLVKEAPLSDCEVRIGNQISIWLSQEAWVGVWWK